MTAEWTKAECQNCGQQHDAAELKEITHGIWERVQPGEPMPAGECPTCGALCHPVVPAQRPIRLTPGDWEEIWYAVEARLNDPITDESDNLPGDEPTGWREHLRAILDKIGPDGATAIAAGVQPTGGAMQQPDSRHKELARFLVDVRDFLDNERQLYDESGNDDAAGTIDTLYRLSGEADQLCRALGFDAERERPDLHALDADGEPGCCHCDDLGQPDCAGTLEWPSSFTLETPLDEYVAFARKNGWTAEPDDPARPTGNWLYYCPACTRVRGNPAIMASKEPMPDVTMEPMGRAAKLNQVAREMLEICRSKCSPADEVILPNGRTNHEVLLDASALLGKTKGTP